MVSALNLWQNPSCNRLLAAWVLLFSFGSNLCKHNLKWKLKQGELNNNSKCMCNGICHRLHWSKLCDKMLCLPCINSIKPERFAVATVSPLECVNSVFLNKIDMYRISEKLRPSNTMVRARTPLTRPSCNHTLTTGWKMPEFYFSSLVCSAILAAYLFNAETTNETGNENIFTNDIVMNAVCAQNQFVLCYHANSNSFFVPILSALHPLWLLSLLSALHCNG